MVRLVALACALFIVGPLSGASPKAAPERVEWIEVSRPMNRGPDRDAEYRRVRAPDFPVAAKSGGTAVVSVVVDVAGKPQFVVLETSSGDDALDHAAVEAVYEWSFWPELKNGQPSQTALSIPITFTLRDDK